MTSSDGVAADTSGVAARAGLTGGRTAPPSKPAESAIGAFAADLISEEAPGGTRGAAPSLETAGAGLSDVRGDR
jgi:hypothetical protein